MNGCVEAFVLFVAGWTTLAILAEALVVPEVALVNVATVLESKVHVDESRIVSGIMAGSDVLQRRTIIEVQEGWTMKTSFSGRRVPRARGGITPSIRLSRDFCTHEKEHDITRWAIAPLTEATTPVLCVLSNANLSSGTGKAFLEADSAEVVYVAAKAHATRIANSKVRNANYDFGLPNRAQNVGVGRHDSSHRMHLLSLMSSISETPFCESVGKQLAWRSKRLTAPLAAELMGQCKKNVLLYIYCWEADQCLFIGAQYW